MDLNNGHEKGNQYRPLQGRYPATIVATPAQAPKLCKFDMRFNYATVVAECACAKTLYKGFAQVGLHVGTAAELKVTDPNIMGHKGTLALHMSFPGL